MQRHDLTTLGGESGEILWRGHRVAFTRHGQGSPVLLVHGLYAGASSFEWRHTIPGLAARHSVFALDLLGFGRSDRPAARYSPGLYQALLSDVVARVIGDACAVVASGLSAAQLIALAVRAPGHIVTPALVACYVHSAQQPGGKHAISALLDGRLHVDVRAAVRRLRLPTLLLWGDVARRNSVAHAHAFRVLKPDMEWTLVHDAGDLPHDERSEQVNAALRSFLERTRRWSGSPGQRLAMA
jgi:pimeloyl-ACP methyl ester carboxylesterase